MKPTTLKFYGHEEVKKSLDALIDKFQITGDLPYVPVPVEVELHVIPVLAGDHLPPDMILLTKDQIDNVVDWMNDHEQLIGSGFSLQFRDEYLRRGGYIYQ